MTSKTICLSYPSVIAQRLPPAAHHSKTTASRRWRGGGAERHDGWETERAGGREMSNQEVRESRGFRVNGNEWVHNKNEGVERWECPSLSRSVSLPVTECFSRRKSPVSSTKLLHHFPFCSLWLERVNSDVSGAKIWHLAAALWDEGWLCEPAREGQIACDKN